jgi:hypothetical protein
MPGRLVSTNENAGDRAAIIKIVTELVRKCRRIL